MKEQKKEYMYIYVYTYKTETRTCICMHHGFKTLRNMYIIYELSSLTFILYNTAEYQVN